MTDDLTQKVNSMDVDSTIREKIDLQQEKQFLKTLGVGFFRNPTKERPMPLKELVEKYRSLFDLPEHEEHPLQSRFLHYGIAGYELVPARTGMGSNQTHYFLSKKEY